MEIPDVRQEDGFGEYGCGDAVIESVCQMFGLKDRPARLGNAVQGMDPATMQALLHSVGFSVLSGPMTLRDLKHFTDTGRPVLCPIDVYGGHWVVVGGVARLRVTFMDSALPKDVPNPRIVNAAVWNAWWKDRNWLGRGYERWGLCVGR